MNQSNPDPIYLVRSLVNSFHYLYGDAKHFHELAKQPERKGKFEVVSMCRTSMLLYILGLEGLINRALHEFLPDYLHDFILDHEKNYKLEDKWVMLPLLVNQSKDNLPHRGRYPWGHFKELIDIRNDYVHPKHNRQVYYKLLEGKNFASISWNQLPSDSGLRETDIVYRHTLIPKDPYAVLPEHVDTVKRVVDDVVVELDQMLGGKLLTDNWLHSEQFTLVYPPGTTFADLR